MSDVLMPHFPEAKKSYYDVFISYSRKDQGFAKKLHADLENIGNKKAWIDKAEIRHGTEWWKEIQKGIEESSTFLFLISPDSIESVPCQAEINYAIKHHKKILPIVYREA